MARPPIPPPAGDAPSSPPADPHHGAHPHPHHGPRRHASATSSAARTDLSVTDLSKLQRLGSVTTRLAYTKPPRRRKRQPFVDAARWWARWSVPGLGMLSEAYVIFSIGLIGPFQEAMFPDCFAGKHTDCPHSLVHATKFLQIVAIVVGMLVGGALLDVLGRRFGSRCAAAIMTAGSLMLTFSSFISLPSPYLGFFIFAQCFYGLGVGGEYPSASASAAERAQQDPRLRQHRGRQMCLTFSQQGMGNLVNCAVILILMAIYGQFGAQIDPGASRAIVAIQFAVAACIAIFMMAWRALKLKESAVWSAEHRHAGKLAETEHLAGGAHASMWRAVLRMFWPRLLATSMTWLANDFAFYGNKLFQSTFFKLLYPGAPLFVRMQWTLLNSFISLLGYYAAAALIDKKWYGRRRMQMVGFLMLFVLFLACGVAYPSLLASASGLHAFQALYFLSSFFNQFGPNCVTWLAAAEVFPTEVRATFQGASAATGKIGAIIADVCFGLVDSRTSFYLSSAFGLFGALLTWLFLPDTTGMSLDELDRMSNYMLTGEFAHYHGEAIAPRHTSPWERWVWRWDRHYDPAMDAVHRQVQEEAAFDEAMSMGGGGDGAGVGGGGELGGGNKVDADSWLAAVGHAAPLSRGASAMSASAAAGAGAGAGRAPSNGSAAAGGAFALEMMMAGNGGGGGRAGGPRAAANNSEL